MTAIDGTRPLPGVAAALVDAERVRQPRTVKARVAYTNGGGKSRLSLIIAHSVTNVAAKRWRVRLERNGGTSLLVFYASDNGSAGCVLNGATVPSSRIQVNADNLVMPVPFFGTQAVDAVMSGSCDSFIINLVNIEQRPPRNVKQPTGPRPRLDAQVQSANVTTDQFREALATVNAFWSQHDGNMQFTIDGGRVRATIMQEF